MDKAAGNTGRTPWGTGAKGGRPKCEGCMRGDGLGWGCVAGTRSIRTSCDISHLGNGTWSAIDEVVLIMAT